MEKEIHNHDIVFFDGKVPDGETLHLVCRVGEKETVMTIYDKDKVRVSVRQTKKGNKEKK